MKNITRVLALLFVTLFVALPSFAARGCSGGANCTACTSCVGCRHCSKEGGTCSVCRPDLYRSAAYQAPQAAPQYQTPSQPSYSPAPSYQQPRRRVTRRQRQSARRVAVPSQFSGKVVGVSDGDTLTVMYNRQPVRIRLYAIDAPEKNQAYGQQAKSYASQLAFGKTATVYSKGVDRYGRVLAWVFIGRQPLNASMVGRGLAWHYYQYSPNETKMAQIEQSARSQRVGLWRDAAPVAPWDFRRKKA